MQKPIVLMHVSDLHFVDDSLRLRDLVRKEGITSKRITGWMNYRLNRRGQFNNSIRTQLIQYLKTSDWDYLVISGDLTTLALKAEFKAARKELEPLIEKGTVIMTSGNHDRYVRGSLEPDLMAQTFFDCFPFNQEPLQGGESHHLELGDSAVLFEIATACPRLHVSSRGRIQNDLEACEAFMQQNYRDRLKLVVGHYPAFLPKKEREGYLHRLHDRKRLQDFLKNSGTDIYLHGHIHKTWQSTPQDLTRPVCLNAAGCCRYADGDWSGFHRIAMTGTQFEVSRIRLPVPA